MKTAVNQPTFFSWLGYFELINYVDNFVFLDNVPFGNKPKRINRNLIADEEGREINISLSITKLNSSTIIKDCEIVFDNNYDRSKNLILEIYKNSEYYKEISEFIIDIYSFKSNNLAEFNINLVKKSATYLILNVNFFKHQKILILKINLQIQNTLIKLQIIWNQHLIVLFLEVLMRDYIQSKILLQIIKRFMYKTINILLIKEKNF